MPSVFEQIRFEAKDFDHTGLNVHTHVGREASAAVVFVHGLGGEGYGTWGMWPELVFNQCSVELLDVIVYQYAGFNKAWKSRKLGADLPFYASQLADWIKVLNEDYGYSDIYLVAHSLGGIVAESAVRKYLLELGTRAPEVTAVAAIFLLASPRLGAGLALSFLRQWVPEFEWLRDKSPLLMEAESYFGSHVESHGTAASAGHYDFLIPRYSAMAGGDRLVSKMSGLFGVPEPQRLRLNGNHRTLVKPDDNNREQHLRLLKIVEQSGEIRRTWRIQARHDARFDANPGTQGQPLVTELVSDNIRAEWEKACAAALLQASSAEVQVRDRRQPTVTSGQATDLLIAIHDAKNIVDQDSRCKVVIEKAFARHQAEENLTLLVVTVGLEHEQAERIVQSWLPDPPYRSLSIEGVLSSVELTGRVIAWVEVIIDRDLIRWPRASGALYGAEGPDFV